MGKYFDKFKSGISAAKKSITEPQYTEGSMMNDFPDEMPYDEESNPNAEYDEGYDGYGDVGIQPSQKPESFHHFILENQYKDLERSIRGYKDIFVKESGQWETKRKREHCFTDEEAEEILRTAQSHLATDIKLGYISKESFPMLMDAIYKEIAFLFESIAEYRYGRYTTNGEEDIEFQYRMKIQNHKIFLELFTRVQANYSRAIQGQENKYTHDSVKGQESLQGGDGLETYGRRRYT